MPALADGRKVRRVGRTVSGNRVISLFTKRAKSELAWGLYCVQRPPETLCPMVALCYTSCAVSCPSAAECLRRHLHPIYICELLGIPCRRFNLHTSNAYGNGPLHAPTAPPQKWDSATGRGPSDPTNLLCGHSAGGQHSRPLTQVGGQQ